MKTYIWIKTKETSKGNVTLNVYRMKNNLPHFITTAYYNNGTTQGADSEAFNALINCGELPKSYYNLSRTSWRGGGYYCEEVEKKGVRIYGMN